MSVAPAPLLVLLEGPSDVGALEEVLARRRPLVARSAYRLVDMGGVTNTAAHLRTAADLGVRALGLCDAGEAWVVARALSRRGAPVADPSDLPRHGFHVCHRDLEEELIRALGVGTCLALLDDLGLGSRFRGFSTQPAWVGRPVEERLHRFAGVASGRKVRLARAMAARLRPEGVPPPMAALVDHLDGGGGGWAP